MSEPNDPYQQPYPQAYQPPQPPVQQPQQPQYAYPPQQFAAPPVAQQQVPAPQFPQQQYPQQQPYPQQQYPQQHYAQQQYPQQQFVPQPPPQAYPQQQFAPPQNPSQPYPQPQYPAQFSGAGAMPPQAGPQPAKKRGKKALVLGLVLVLVAAGGVTAYLLTNSKKGGVPRGQGLNIAWSQNAPNSIAASAGEVGAWVADGAVEVATGTIISAFDLSSGNPTWTWTPPAGQQICAMSPSVVQHFGIVGVGTDATSCTEMLAVDTRTGKTAWTKPASLTLHGGNSSSFPNIVVGTTEVYALDGSGALDAYDLASGTEKWSIADDKNYTGDNCIVDAEAYESGAVYATVKCDSGNYLSTLDATTGVRKGDPPALPSYCVSGNIIDYLAVSPKYVIVDCSDHSSGKIVRYVVNPIGTSTLTSVQLPSASSFDPLSADGAQILSSDYAIVGGTFYVVTLSGSTDTSNQEVLNAVDLSSGAKKWSKPLARSYVLLSADASGVSGLAFGVGSSDDVDVVDYGAAGGQVTTKGTMPNSGGTSALDGRQQYIAVGSQIVVVASTAHSDAAFVTVLTVG